MDKDANILASEVSGEIKVEANLPESPEIGIKMKFEGNFVDTVVHKCCLTSRDRFERESYLRFIPPNGPFTVLKYISTPFTFQLPFQIEPMVAINDNKFKVTLKLQKMMVRGAYLNLDNMLIKIIFP